MVYSVASGTGSFILSTLVYQQDKYLLRFAVIECKVVKLDENAFALGQIEILNELPLAPGYLAANGP